MDRTPILISLGAVAFIILYFAQRLIVNWALFSQNKKVWLNAVSCDLWKNWIEPFLVAGILALVIRTFLLGPYKIPTASMRPTFMEGDRIFVDKISYRLHPPHRGDIIVFKYPLDPKKDYVKRLAGLPGEALLIKEGKLYINGAPLDEPPFSNLYYYNRNDWQYAKEGAVIQVPLNSYFALGDNSAQSSDSRNWGFVPAKNLVGRAFFIWWPPKRIKIAE
ncbi:MAG: signal peptidase I [Candidatus Omnitrophica bacterium]|nr:signal peptidase I [Candidatus Omnitrophota bacterium]